jgi:hypothetical protein
MAVTEPKTIKTPVENNTVEKHKTVETKEPARKRPPADSTTEESVAKTTTDVIADLSRVTKKNQNYKQQRVLLQPPKRRSRTTQSKNIRVSRPRSRERAPLWSLVTTTEKSLAKITTSNAVVNVHTTDTMDLVPSSVGDEAR